MTKPDALAARLLDALPQTQCTRCGYADCAAYAQAMAREGEAINRCPPGGDEGVARLAELTARPPLALDPDCGAPGPLRLARIDEAWCIGCTLCLKACPTDAIVGTHKRMHTVIESACTGCELCLPPCPVDCIEMVDTGRPGSGWQVWSQAEADEARTRYAARQERLTRDAQAHAVRQEAKAQEKLADLAAHSRIEDPEALARKRALIEAAMARARARREAASS